MSTNLGDVHLFFDFRAKEGLTITIDFTKIERYDEVCRGYGGYSLENNENGRWVDFEEVVKILAAHGIECRTAESVANEKFEAEMVAKYGKDWRS